MVIPAASLLCPFGVHASPPSTGRGRGGRGWAGAGRWRADARPRGKCSCCGYSHVQLLRLVSCAVAVAGVMCSPNLLIGARELDADTPGLQAVAKPGRLLLLWLLTSGCDRAEVITAACYSLAVGVLNNTLCRTTTMRRRRSWGWRRMTMRRTWTVSGGYVAALCLGVLKLGAGAKWDACAMHRGVQQQR